MNLESGLHCPLSLDESSSLVLISFFLLVPMSQCPQVSPFTCTWAIDVPGLLIAIDVPGLLMYLSY